MIKIYTTPACVFCEMAKEFLKEKKIAYKEYDISRDEKAQKEMLEKSHQLAVPVFDIDGKILINFNRVQLEEAIKKQKSKSIASTGKKRIKTKIKTKKSYGTRSDNRRRGTGRSGRRNLRRPKKT
ncbi:MAG: glutaredoxin family protein [bacterium]|nr:glutaredoxin family protein [bacterium]